MLESKLREKDTLIESHLQRIRSLTDANTELKNEKIELQRRLESELK